ncbi:SUF system Fe-S cluster assembly regulator [Denitratisoma oestradiolicum]|nr:SUF system Fe-S cluster assembly regulator [Denitratisoma oestradiolicum]
MRKLTDYSTVIMAYLAQSPLGVHSVAEMAAAVGVAAPTTSKILKTLARQNLVLSSRGIHGGYRLSRPPEQISIAQVIDAMEGPFGMTECSIEAGLCAQEAACPQRENWQRLNQVLRRALDQVSLADMTGPSAHPVPANTREPRP